MDFRSSLIYAVTMSVTCTRPLPVFQMHVRLTLLNSEPEKFIQKSNLIYSFNPHMYMYIQVVGPIAAASGSLGEDCYTGQVAQTTQRGWELCLITLPLGGNGGSEH